MTPDADGTGAPVDSGRRRRRLLVLAALAVVALAYFGLGSFIAYTDDAYVQSDFVALAPEVSGVVSSVAVTDNAQVKIGDTLVFIDPQPFALDVKLREERVAAAVAVREVKESAAAAMQANIDAAQAGLRLAQQEYDRVAPLVKEQALSQAEMDRTSDALSSARDTLAESRSRAEVATREVAAAHAASDTARAEQAIAAYALSRTQIRAPVNGFVTNLTLRPGAYAKESEPLLGIVDSTRFRIIANFKEYVAASLTEGTPVWLWLDSYPWRIFKGRVQSVGRGVARREVADRLLPYVAPTTDWIRLQRRLPVTIVFDPVPEVPLSMGTDARVLLVR